MKTEDIEIDEIDLRKFTFKAESESFRRRNEFSASRTKKVGGFVMCCMAAVIWAVIFALVDTKNYEDVVAMDDAQHALVSNDAHLKSEELREAMLSDARHVVMPEVVRK